MSRWWRSKARHAKPPVPAWVTVIGWGPFRMPGERWAWAEAERRTREMLDSIDKDKADG